jgi:uncharacterized membrane protein
MLCRHLKNNPMLLDWLPTALGTVGVAMLYYTGSRELSMYTVISYTSLWKMAYYLFFASALSVIISAVGRFRLFVVVALWAIGCLYYWLFNESEIWASVYKSVLYWMSFAGLCGLFVIFARLFFKQKPYKLSSGKVMMWIFNMAAIISLSIALAEVIKQITSHNNVFISQKAAITILWSLSAFVQMWLGMRLKYKTLRIISLSLLGLVLCKLFLYDLNNVSTGAKIVAFVVLGVVLLVMSFLYQKLKKILFEEDEKDDINLID